MTNNKRSTTATSQKTSPPSPTKKGSPPRKAIITRENRNGASSHLQVKFSEVGIDDFCVAKVDKANGTDSAYMYPINRRLNADEAKKERGNLVYHTFMRKSKEEDELLETPSQKGTLYNTDVYILYTNGAIAFHQATANLTKVFNEIARDEAKDDFKYGTPSFVNKGDCTPPVTPCLQNFLLDKDCISVIKRIYQDTETKEALMENEYRDAILETVFGDCDVGLKIINALDDKDYEEY